MGDSVCERQPRKTVLATTFFGYNSTTAFNSLKLWEHKQMDSLKRDTELAQSYIALREGHVDYKKSLDILETMGFKKSERTLLYLV